MAIEVQVLPERVAGPWLELRAWRPDDVDALAAAVTASVGHLRPFLDWAAHEPMARAARLALVEGWDAARLAGGDVVYGMFLDGEVVGGTGLHRRRGPGALEIGYWVHVDHVGRGIATESSRLLTVAALAQPGVTAVEIHHDRANLASRRVPEKLGYTCVGEAPSGVTAPGQEGVDVTWRRTTTDGLDPAPSKSVPSTSRRPTSG